MPISQSTKSPAFQFYPKDFLADEEQTLLSLAEAGAYIRLLSRCWLKGSLPAETGELAKLCSATPAQMQSMWPAISKCFTQRSDGRWLHPRLEIERKRQAEFRRKQSENGKRGGRPKGLGFSGLSQTLPKESSPNSYLLSPSATTTKKERTKSAEPQSDSTPPVMEFPVVGAGAPTWTLTQGRVDEWQMAYPNLGVVNECLKAQAWIRANVSNRKTAGGMPAFLVRWLNKATERSGPRGLALASTGTEGRGRTGAPPSNKYDGIEEG
jgi:uncharacterized protein YdaU (DUF1376 family)